MAIPTGGLNQVSAQQKPPAPAPAGGKFDASAVQAENIEEITKAKPTGLKETIVDDLGDQREAMNAALLRMRESLDVRKNRLFDPVLMQTAAGFLKPTKTGSFGESLGYAAVKDLASPGNLRFTCFSMRASSMTFKKSLNLPRGAPFSS